MSQPNSDNQFSTQRQTAGDVTVSGDENPVALVNAAGNAAIDQSRHIIYNYYYYREETKATPAPLPNDHLPCPYRGLFHFGPDDVEFFFGREVFVTELVQAVQARAFVPVLGASGSGKSSVVFAGLVPHLQQMGHWQFTHFRPGADPFQALALALVPLYVPEQDATDQIAQARKLANYLQTGEVLLADVISRIRQHYPNQRVLLIGDQFEELYTLCPEEAIRRSFLDCLLTSLATAQVASSPLMLVATMRADFLGNALSYRPFADVLQAGDVKLGAMNRKELCEVIEQPAAKLGVAFAAGLAKRMLDAVINEPGNLPLLEFALTELWARRSGRQLTHEAYEAIGEVEGALARYADQQYAQLSVAEQEQVRRIFVQLVRPGEGTEDTRRLATKVELGEERWALVTQLANSRLVVTSQDGVKQETVEVVHEALIRNWGELRGWMTADRTFRVWQDRLRVAMQQWEEMNRDEGALLRGAALVEAGERLQKRREDLSPAEQHFIQASLTQQQQERRQQERRRQMTLLGLSGFSAVALGLAGLAGWQWHQSEQAQLNTLIQSAKILLTSDRAFDAILSYLQAARKLQHSILADDALKAQVAAALQQTLATVKEQNRLKDFKGSVNTALFSPNGQVIATADERAIALWRLDGTLQTRLDESLDKNDQVVMEFSQDGQTIATFHHWQTLPGSVKIWGLDGKPRDSAWGNKQFSTVQFSPDHQTVGTFDGKTFQLWQWDGQPIALLSSSDAKHSTLQFSGDGQIVVTTAPSHNPNRQFVKFWRRDGKFLSQFEMEKKINVATLNRDGSLVVTADGQNLRLQRRDGHSVSPLAGSLPLDNTYISQVSFSPDDQTIAVVNSDTSGTGKGTVRLWQKDGHLRATLTGHEQNITEMQFSPDSQRIATASDDKTVKVWSLDGTLLTTLSGHGDSVNTLEFNPKDTNLLVSGSRDSTLRQWTIKEPSHLQKGKFSRVVFSQDQKEMVTTIQNGPVQVWKLDGTPIATLLQNSGSEEYTRLSRDGKTIVTNVNGSNAAGSVQLWNGQGTLIKTLINKSAQSANQDQGWVGSNLSEDGNVIVTRANDSGSYGPVQLWNGSGNLVKTLLPKTSNPAGASWIIVWLSLTHDGQMILTEVVSPDFYGPVQLWDRSGNLIKTLFQKTESQHYSHPSVSVSFSRDDQTIMTEPRSSASYGPIQLWNARGELQATLAEATAQKGFNSNNSVSFSQDGHTLLTIINRTDAHSVVKLWRSDGTLIKTLVDEPNMQGSVTATFSHRDDQLNLPGTPEMIVTAIPGGALRQWGTDGTLLRTITEHLQADQQISKLQLSPDSQILAIQVRDREVQLWHVNGTLLQRIQYDGVIEWNALTFSPDSQMFASGSSDNTVKLWQRQENRVIPLEGHTAGISELHFAADSKHLISVDKTGKLVLLPLEHLADLQSWVEQGCRQVHNYLEHTRNLSQTDKHICDDV